MADAVMENKGERTMKKTGGLAGMMLLAWMGVCPAEAGFVARVATEGTGVEGMQDREPAVIPVVLALSLRDQTAVTLEGHIIRQAGSQLYTFRDETGRIGVRIVDAAWPSRAVTPADRVRLEGRVSRDWLSVGVEVRTVKLLTGVSQKTARR